MHLLRRIMHVKLKFIANLVFLQQHPKNEAELEIEHKAVFFKP